MDEFLEYQRFQNLDDARFLIDILDANQIQFKIDDSALRFEMAAIALNPLGGGIVILIRQSDKERVDQINFKSTESSSINDHYMYSLSDNDIIDVIVNPVGWTEEEIILANEISKQRNLKPTAKLIKSLRKDKLAINIDDDDTKQNNIIKNGTSWFLCIAILSVCNIIALIFHQNLHFVTGLGINYTILGMMEGIQRASGINLIPLGFFLSFVVCGFFFWIWSKSKKDNQKVYLTGLIIYGIDTVIFIFAKDWFSIAFHLFAFMLLFAGYKALLTKKKEKNTYTA